MACTARIGTNVSPTCTIATSPSTQSATTSRRAPTSPATSAAGSGPSGCRGPACPRVEPSVIGAVEFGMEALGGLDGAPAAKVCLEPLVEQYRDWIAAQRRDAAAFTGRRREVAEELVRRAAGVADRIQAGIDLLSEADVLEAFRVANRAMAAAARAGGRRRKGDGRGTSRRRRGVPSSSPTS